MSRCPGLVLHDPLGLPVLPVVDLVEHPRENVIAKLVEPGLGAPALLGVFLDGGPRAGDLPDGKTPLAAPGLEERPCRNRGEELVRDRIVLLLAESPQLEARWDLALPLAVVDVAVRHSDQAHAAF
eukprot:CAMPEP_0180211736 /NCGR_PEP_ID=MMETSP0987-20121128/13023_1 /TAXON_ID=697907 /ORGANISM="non described non described, Strain CCMP2293" /LENGTH=125 /DNA_ID=CAMNT_0022169151 /DNA_START=144 /DNA_END=521 /DNA_ORIENTATION=-